jgi:hypothetical protein
MALNYCDDCGKKLPRGSGNAKRCRACHIISMRGLNNVMYKGNNASRQAKHQRISSVRSKATKHECVDCLGPAEQWSQIHNTDPNNIISYMPRCRSCHTKYDSTKEGRARISESMKGNKLYEGRERDRNGRFI